ncbi:immunoglobulin superfamily member 10 isoform X1 [Phyllopteryx taeniolatus]|uniref:immunoglobulin superfamily member 10 isoform X1 n=4 Tax=Phyllopteryx taeniolatus TaxID=161469 RepID=UPI002AD3E8A5|nr:immunoglobulin superfamily member 10 isoform X1 [Phyllopteryx taeniolatus]XP_061638017.1 immunoglobulin superfamily member 10 isoform X1 [Phyllopteryx taeniolatus]
MRFPCTMTAYRGFYLWRCLLSLGAPLLLLAAVSPVRGNCPTACVCSVPAEVHCTFRYLNAVPAQIQPAVERINLGYNSITVLRENALLLLQKLEILMLHSNLIHSIEDGAFQDLRSLQVLKMSYNKVKELNRQTFKGLESLQRLYMDHNYIDFISPDAFYGLTNLQLVHLEGNHLQQLHPDTFITLRHSQVFKVSSLRTIHLSHNILTSLPEEVFSGCSHLENLFLHGNRWACDCRMNWLPLWLQKHTEVLKCKRDRRYPRGQLCPVCENPTLYKRRPLSLLPSDAFTCTKPLIQPHLKQKNISLDEGDFTPVSPRDFIAPLGSIQMNLTDQFHNDASLSCTVQRPSNFENLSLTMEEEGGHNITALTTAITTYLVCNIDNEHIQHLWQILAAYSESPMRLERGLLLTTSPEMVYKYSQKKMGEDELHTNIDAEIKALPAWLMQGEVSLQLDRITTTFSTLHIKYQSVVNLWVENTIPKKDHYSWTMIKKNNETKTEHTIITGGVVQLSCQVRGEPKPVLEWILPDGIKVRAPYVSEDNRIIITAEGKLTLRGADTSDTGLYHCIATNYLDADILVFRVTVMSPDVEEADVNGVHISKKLGEHLLFDCSSSGCPKASVQWILPDHTILDRSQGKRKVYENGTLLIEGLTVRDRGFFRCLAANHLGVDLLVSQVTANVSSEVLTDFDNDGSGMEIESQVDRTLADNTITVSDIPFYKSSVRATKKAITIVSDRRDPKLRSQGKSTSGSRIGQRRYSVSNRRAFGNRVFDKTIGKVDPKKFAEFMKKAQDGARANTNNRNAEKESKTALSNHNEIGSGEVHDDDLILLAMVSTHNPQEGSVNGMENTESEIAISKNSHGVTFSQEREKLTTDYMPIQKSIFTCGPEKTEREGVTPYDMISLKTDVFSFDETTKLHSLERFTKPELVTDSSEETQLHFSREHPSEPETSTEAFSFNTDPNFTPMRDSTDLVELLVHSDPESQSTITAVTTTRRREDQITFHTTQTIKSPPLGSTIISKQQIHIIPHKKRRGGRRRVFHGRRRIIKPNSITDIQSIINKRIQSSEQNSTVPYRIEVTTDMELSTPTMQFGARDKVGNKMIRGRQRKPITTETLTTPQTSTDDYGDLFSADFELSNLKPTAQPLTTMRPTYYSKSLTTADTPPESQTLSSPPTVKSPPGENPVKEFDYASGGLPDDFPTTRPKSGEKRGRQGRRRRPSKGHRPSKKLKTIKLYPISTTETFANKKPTMETTVQTTLLPQKSASKSPMYTPSREINRVTGTSEQQTYTYKKVDWGISYTTRTPFILSNTMPTSERPYTTAQNRVYNNLRPPTQRYNGQTAAPRRPRPTAQSGTKESREKYTSFGTMTIYTTEQDYIYTYNRNNVKNILVTTSSNVASTQPTTMLMTRKPKILGGNAASFTVLTNSDALLPCEAVGDPLPVISWKRLSSSTGNTVTIKGRMGKFEFLSNGTLSIQNANIKDRGQYICVAENDHGSDKLIVTLSVVTYPSRILEPKMREIKSHAGNTVEIKCKADGRPTPTISWILANRTQVRGQNTPNGRVSVNPGGTLVIRQVSGFDRGHYKCVASNPAGADTATVRLLVVAAPPGIFEEKRQQVKAVSKQNIWLPCTGQGSPQPRIHWVLHDGLVVNSQRFGWDTRISVYDNGTLQIKDVTPTDNGKYECIATSSTGSERRVVTLTIERQESVPKIVATSHHVTELYFGDQLKLNCSATGDPEPRIMWRLPSKAVIDQWHRMGRRFQVLENGTLIINSVIDKDAGDYRCMAKSITGDDVQLMNVKVSMKPAKIEHKPHGKKKVLYGNDLKVDCKASGAPKPEISWGLPDGTVVNSALQADSFSGGRRIRRYTLFDNGTLYVNQVGMSEEGDYTCIAENQVGKDEMHVHITVVTAAPMIRQDSETYARLKPGENIRFDCEGVGEPKPRILWILPTNDVIAASNERYLLHVNGSLDIRGAKTIDGGEYVCMARNPGGENRRIYKLEISGNPPVINGNHQNRTVLKDFSTKYSRKLIDCNAEGNPTPTITWIMPENIFLRAPYFGGRINVHHNGTLEIRNVRPTDTGEFICMATNDGGESVLVVQLEVTNMLRRPIFKNPFNERIVSPLGKTNVLNCSADGHPKPDINWILPNGTRFIAGHNFHRHADNDGTLVIYNSRIEDAGKYRCGAKNIMGYIEKLIILDVGQKPYILTRPRDIIRSMFGDPLFIHCLSDGSPIPRIYWTLPGGHTLTRPQVLGRYNLLENGTLIVQDTTLRDRGNYVCRARNDVGEAVLTVPVVIIAYPPRITTMPPPTLSLMAGTPVKLNCAAIGVPKPEITWELPDHSILSMAQQRKQLGSELLHPQGTLIVQRLSAINSGTYKCVAKNYLGTDLKAVYVHVL